MAEYMVEYVIVIDDAESPRDAAEKAAQNLIGGTYNAHRSSYTVFDLDTGEAEQVDLNA